LNQNKEVQKQVRQGRHNKAHVFSRGNFNPENPTFHKLPEVIIFQIQTFRNCRKLLPCH
jgi:hypothetical protein